MLVSQDLNEDGVMEMAGHVVEVSGAAAKKMLPAGIVVAEVEEAEMS